jgi:GTPase SAR1 family protein
MKKITHKGQAYSLELWDTAGHERYRTVVYNYFSYAQAAIVVFDLSDEQSLD